MISLNSPIKTKAHNWPTEIKLIGLFCITAILFFIQDTMIQLTIFISIISLYALPGIIFLKSGIKKLTILWPFVVLISLWHLIEGSHTQGFNLVLRLLSSIAFANLITMTTTLTQMIDTIKKALKPLRILGIQTHALEIAIALSIRMTPVLLDKGQKLTEAWRARSTHRFNIRLMLPFTLLALDDANQVAEALKARGGIKSKHTK